MELDRKWSLIGNEARSEMESLNFLIYGFHFLLSETFRVRSGNCKAIGETISKNEKLSDPKVVCSRIDAYLKAKCKFRLTLKSKVWTVR